MSIPTTTKEWFLPNPIAGILFVVVFVTVATPVFGQSAESFLNRMTVKFRQTSNIFLRARSNRIQRDGTPTDTMTVTLAYRYPDQLLQWVQMEGQREQMILYRGDTVVVSYPHINVTRRETVDRERLHRIILKQVPFAGVFVGLASDAVDPDSVTVRDSGPFVQMTFQGGNSVGSQIIGRFQRDTLYPVGFKIRDNRGRYRVKILEYTEETRFPRHVERAITELRPERLKESHP